MTERLAVAMISGFVAVVIAILGANLVVSKIAEVRATFACAQTGNCKIPSDAGR